MLEITLNIEGKDKKFTQEKITLGAMRRLAEMDRNLSNLREQYSEEEIGLETIDEMAMTIVSLFGKQFTFDELVDGLEFDNMDEFNEIVEGIFSQVAQETEEPGKGKQPAKKTAAKKKAPSK